MLKSKNLHLTATAESSKLKASQFIKKTEKKERANMIKKTMLTKTKDCLKYPKAISFPSPKKFNTKSEA
jgi:hypothetical protein